MPLSSYARDNFVVQEYSALTTFDVQPIGPNFTGHKSWLTTFVLNTIFTTDLPSASRALAFALLRRAEAAVEDFDAACAVLSELVAAKKTVSGYFRGLRVLEATISQLYQALEFVRKASGTKLFQKGDGSRYERLNRIYNVSRHGDPQALPAGHLQLVWLRDDGVHVEGASMTFGELRELVVELATAAEHLSACRPWIPETSSASGG